MLCLLMIGTYKIRLYTDVKSSIGDENVLVTAVIQSLPSLRVIEAVLSVMESILIV